MNGTDCVEGDDTLKGSNDFDTCIADPADIVLRCVA
jgi:hypothetical protein